jgi:hypothetical protein
MFQRFLMAVVVLAALGVVASFGFSGADKPPGLESYTPTRMDWLIVKMNSSYLTENDILSVRYVGDSITGTVTIMLDHKSDAPRSEINDELNHARKLVASTAKNYGWHDWVKIKEKISQRGS